MQQVVFDFERQEGASGLQYATRLSKCALLGGARTQVVQHQDCDGQGKGAISKRQRRRIGLYYGVWVLAGKLGCKRVAPLETRDARREPPQRSGACSRPSTEFEHVIAQRVSRNDPRQQMIAR